MDIQKTFRAKLMEIEKKVLYSAVVLDEKSTSKLFAIFGDFIPEGWAKFAHHMTIAFGKSLEALGLGEDNGKTIHLHVTEYGISEMAVAVKVEGYKSTNKFPHITLAINKAQGGKPVMSNDIADWKTVEEPLVIQGTVTNVTN